MVKLQLYSTRFCTLLHEIMMEGIRRIYIRSDQAAPPPHGLALCPAIITEPALVRVVVLPSLAIGNRGTKDISPMRETVL